MPTQYRREPLPARVCPGCGQTYQPSRVTHNFCTKDCGKRAKYVPKVRQRRALADRFWVHVDRSGGPDDCWPWTGATVGDGYGTFGVPRPDGEGWTQTTSNRVALELAEGRPLLPDERACHTCDNPPCCNPKHLFRGTQAVNLEDMDRKGRRRRIGSGPLQHIDPVELSRLAQAGESQTALAARFGVGQSSISRALRRLAEQQGDLTVQI